MRGWQLIVDDSGSVEGIYALILHKVEIWSGVTDALLNDSKTLEDRATQLLMKYKSGALVTQLEIDIFLLGSLVSIPSIVATIVLMHLSLWWLERRPRLHNHEGGKDVLSYSLQH